MNPESITALYASLPIWVIVLITTWSLVWKGLALWKASAVKKNPIWFIVLLVVNTIGLLEILYLFVFSKMGEKKTESVKDIRKKKK